MIKKITRYRILLNQQQFDLIIEAMTLLAQMGEPEEMEQSNELLDILGVSTND